MKNWNQLFIRQGFMVKEISENVFDCWNETEENMQFLLESLENLSVTFSFDGLKTLIITSPVVIEEKWLHCVGFNYRGKSEGFWFRPGKDEPKVRELDPYISGVVRQLNRLGLHTTYSCDGHSQRRPLIEFAQWVDLDQVIKVLNLAGVSRVTIRNRQVRLFVTSLELMDVSEKLTVIQKGWINQDIEYINQQLFLNCLEQCLSINGESGNEEEIRQFVISSLQPYVDDITVDSYGNILAEKTYGHGQGPTILLNSHLDTVLPIEEGRVIMKEGAIWYSNKGILGADDRAGVAVLLELAKVLPSLTFNGKVKWVFTVEEEVGLVGAKNLQDYFLWGVDAAFVVDRCGTGNIVTSCGGYEDFCNKNFGLFLEELIESKGLSSWKCTTGGSSDTRIWARHGIQSVNLSVGYQHEHTSKEKLDTEATYNTLKLLITVFENARELRQIVRRIQRSAVV
jgi:tripeptide aminopeptidase